MRRRSGWIGLVLVLGSSLWVAQPADAQYYGTSRRVARRTARRTSARQYGMYESMEVAAPTSVVTTLPAGCVAVDQGGVPYQRCGTVTYRPYYQGDQLVYAAVP